MNSFISSPVIAFLPQLEYEDQKYFVHPNFKVRNELYKNKVEMFGGVILDCDYNTMVDDILTQIDGWLIPGGADIDPQAYGEEKGIKTVCHRFSNARIEWEKELWEKMDKKMPILGICYGAQVINVLSGGTLIQHLANADNHRQGAKHKIKIKEDTLLKKVIQNTEIQSHCNHHQLKNKIPDNLRINCTDEDGLVHGIEAKEEGRWIIGVQWHPERCDDELNTKFFDEFIQAARKFKKEKERNEKKRFYDNKLN